MSIKGINPGRLNKRLIIMKYQETEDELGNTVNVLKPLKKIWGEIRPIRGDEQLEYYKNVNTIAVKITVRNTDITEKDVIEYENRQFLINYIINPLESNYYLEIICTEKKDHRVKEE